MTKESVRDLTVDELDRVGGGGVPMGPPIYVTIPFPILLPVVAALDTMRRYSTKF